MGVGRNFFREGKYYKGEKFEFDGTGTNKGAGFKSRTAKSINILICFTFLRSFW